MGAGVRQRIKRITRSRATAVASSAEGIHPELRDLPSTFYWNPPGYGNVHFPGPGPYLAALAEFRSVAKEASSDRDSAPIRLNRGLFAAARGA